MTTRGFLRATIAVAVAPLAIVAACTVRDATLVAEEDWGAGGDVGAGGVTGGGDRSAGDGAGGATTDDGGAAGEGGRAGGAAGAGTGGGGGAGTSGAGGAGTSGAGGEGTSGAGGEGTSGAGGAGTGGGGASAGGGAAGAPLGGGAAGGAATGGSPAGGLGNGGAAGDGGAGAAPPAVSREWTKRVVTSLPARVDAAASDLTAMLFFVAHGTDGVALQQLDLRVTSATVETRYDASAPADEVAVGAGAVYGMVDALPTFGSDTLSDASFVRFGPDGSTDLLDALALVGTAAADGEHAYWAAFDTGQTSLDVKRVRHDGDQAAVETVTTVTFGFLPATVELGAASGRVYFGMDLATTGRLQTLDANGDGAPMPVAGAEALQVREFVVIRPGLLYLIARTASVVRLFRLEGSTLTEIHAAQAEGTGPTLRHLTHADDFVYVLDAPSDIPCVSGETIWAAAIETGERAQLTADAQCAEALAAVTGAVYYFDGSNLQEISAR
jgi:hypothetical protein